MPERVVDEVDEQYRAGLLRQALDILGDDFPGEDVVAVAELLMKAARRRRESTEAMRVVVIEYATEEASRLADIAEHLAVRAAARPEEQEFAVDAADRAAAAAKRVDRLQSRG